MKNRSLLALSLAFVTPLLALGCADDGEADADSDGGEPTLDTLAAAEASIMCGKIFACCPGGTDDGKPADPEEEGFHFEFKDEAACNASLTQVIRSEIAFDGSENRFVEVDGARVALGESATVDPELARRCETEMRAANEASACSQVTAEGAAILWDDRICEWAVGGPVGEGGSCTVYYGADDQEGEHDGNVCRPGLTCFEGLCRAPQGEGAACNDRDDCLESFTCGNDGLCKPTPAPRALGESCNFEGECGLNECNNGVCETGGYGGPQCAP